MAPPLAAFDLAAHMPQTRRSVSLHAKQKLCAMRAMSELCALHAKLHQLHALQATHCVRCMRCDPYMQHDKHCMRCLHCMHFMQKSTACTMCNAWTTVCMLGVAARSACTALLERVAHALLSDTGKPSAYMQMHIQKKRQ